MKIRIPWFKKSDPKPEADPSGHPQTNLPDQPDQDPADQTEPQAPDTERPADMPPPQSPMEDTTPMAAAVPLIMAGLQVAPTVVSFIQDLVKRAEVNKPQPGQGQSRKSEVTQAAQRWAVPGELPAGATGQQLASLVQAIFDAMNREGQVNRPPAQVVQGAVPGAAPNGVDPGLTGGGQTTTSAATMTATESSLAGPAAQMLELAIDQYIRANAASDGPVLMLSWCRLRITDLRQRLSAAEGKLAEVLSTPGAAGR